MGWRNNVRKKINQAKSRRNNNKYTAEIYQENKKYNEKNIDKIIGDGRSLKY